MTESNPPTDVEKLAERLEGHARYLREDGAPAQYAPSLLGGFQLADDIRALLLLKGEVEEARARENGSSSAAVQTSPDALTASQHSAGQWREVLEAHVELLRRQDAAITGTDIALIREDGGIDLAKRIVNLKLAAQWVCGQFDKLLDVRS